MSATVHLVCGPAGSGKTARLRERYRAAASVPGAALWLGPTRRATEAIRDSFANGCSLLAPHVFSFQDFAEEIVRANDPEARPLSEVQRRLLADDLIAELHRRKELSHFARVADTRGFTEGVFALLAELKRAGARPEELARHAGSRKVSQCAHLYECYQQHLHRLNLFDLEGRLWYARDLLSCGRRRPFEEVRAVFVDGFTDFTRTQREILRGMCVWVEEMWLALPDEEGDERAELFTRPRAVVERLSAFSRERPASATARGTLAAKRGQCPGAAAAHFSFIKRSPCVYTSSALGNRSRQTRVAAARSGSARPNDSMVSQPS